MKRRHEPSPPGPSAVESKAALSPAWQIGLSAVLAFHIFAVFVPPMMVATGASPAVAPVFAVLRPYMELCYLNHGYFFFAPNPGPTHLVRYELEFDDGREPVVDTFPNRDTQWPRLLYHRHFMLAESVNMLYRSPRPAPEPREPADGSRQARRRYQRAKAEWDREYAAWQVGRANYEKLMASIEDHLKHRYAASDVTLIRVEHRPLTPPEFREDRLNPRDDETYMDLPDNPLDIPRTEVLPWNPVPSR